MEELLKAGYKVIGETYGGFGQSRHVFFSREENGIWGYLVVEMSDDGEIWNTVGLINGKVVQVD